MGVVGTLDSMLKRGSLFSFVNVLAVDFSDEDFQNIGAYTDEMFLDNIQKIKGMKAQISMKRTLQSSLLSGRTILYKGFSSFFS